MGALVWRKGYDVLLEAAKMAEVPWTVDIIGEGPLRDRLERLATDSAGRVRLLGYRPDAASVASEYDFFCLPTRGEAAPYSCLEAMASGRPIVGTAVDGISDMIVDGESGYLVPPDDALGLARAMDRVAADSGLRHSMGVAAHLRARAFYTKDEMVRGTCAVYAASLNRRQSSVPRRKSRAR